MEALMDMLLTTCPLTERTMRIGKNELEVMKFLNREADAKMRYNDLRSEFKQDHDSENYRSHALSRVLYSLTEKGLVMKYARVTEGPKWEFDDRRAEDSDGSEAVLLKAWYDGRMDLKETNNLPSVELLLGLTEKGKEELEERL
ncbi:hypothetical protein AKJ39_01245 [candidate division MSBL1 archaeon SCGC-AAA259J03]|uniref:Uncharacterized protein n=1 Tax=candidate division MSBL1 archaeon SCGC-AAA259J03 TaxID=1698269 RepID=A0A656YXG1_9EURY|nr:hypothetical protein AKJ39_01245 [candidate division MSBL1 archaeon SCGC-AAA259J03]